MLGRVSWVEVGNFIMENWDWVGLGLGGRLIVRMEDGGWGLVLWINWDSYDWT